MKLEKNFLIIKNFYNVIEVYDNVITPKKPDPRDIILFPGDQRVFTRYGKNFISYCGAVFFLSGNKVIISFPDEYKFRASLALEEVITRKEKCPSVKHSQDL